MYIQKQLKTVLTGNEVSEIEIKIGDKFNPEKHEVIKGKERNDKKQAKIETKVVKVILKGYQMGGKVICPARVVVK